MKKKMFCVLLVLAVVLPPIVFTIGANQAYASEKEALDRAKDAVVLYVGSSKALVYGKETYIDPDNPDVLPFIRNNEAYAPLRFIAEALGGEAAFSSDNTATVKLGSVTARVKPGSRSLTVNGREITMTAPAVAVNGRIFIPIKFCEYLTDKHIAVENGVIMICDGTQLFSLPEEDNLLNSLISQLTIIPSFGTEANFTAFADKLISEREKLYGQKQYDAGLAQITGGAALAAGIAGSVSEAGSRNSAAAPSAEAAEAPIAMVGWMGDSSASSDHSELNVQVAGVDEADIVRTDGTYIYAISSGELAITKAYPAGEMKLTSRTQLDGFNPSEMYVDGNRLILIGTFYPNAVALYPAGGATAAEQPAAEVTMDVAYYIPGRGVGTKAVVIDISDRANPRIQRELTVEGSYMTSRKIGDSVYIIANGYYDMYNKDAFKPRYKDTASSDDYADVPYSKLFYFPGFTDYSYLTVAGFNAADASQKPDIAVYMGSGSVFYVSGANMYIAANSYNYAYDDTIRVFPRLTSVMKRNAASTIIHKFGLYDGYVNYVTTGVVPGTVLNQFSMDEYDGYFRIATTDQNANHLYILDNKLEIKNKIEDIAPGERIYSVRFMGRRGYMVTFKTTDPLFVFDLDPDNMKLLGALKIPGYSDYLHPYDENTLIGFGKDTVEYQGTAYYQGMKMAMFDITDVTNPIQKHMELIGDRGTNSELLNTHKALLFDKQKNLLAFPVEVYKNSGTDNSVFGYGSFTFQGAYVYEITKEAGFVKKGEITHISEEDIKKSGVDFYDRSRYVNRILYIGNVLYTVSDKTVMANDMKSINFINSVDMY